MYPALSPLWRDTSQILSDLHAAWTIAFSREPRPPAGRAAS